MYDYDQLSIYIREPSPGFFVGQGTCRECQKYIISTSKSHELALKTLRDKYRNHRNPRTHQVCDAGMKYILLPKRKYPDYG